MAKDHLLEDIRLFKDLSRSQLRVLEQAGEHREYSVGDTIFKEGQDGTHVYCVIDGRVEISLALGEVGDEAPVHVATPGSVFGEFILFEKSKRSATARAVKPVTMYTITAERLREVFADDPQAGYKVMDNLCRILVGRMNKTTSELRSSLMW
jgi:CRP/FNR family transcriptional regulator, cyclic AMP receptor protein